MYMYINNILYTGKRNILYVQISGYIYKKEKGTL